MINHNGKEIFKECVYMYGLPRCSAVKNPPANAGAIGDLGSIPESGRSPGKEDPLEQPTPVFLPRKSHGQRSLAGYRCCKELDKHEYAHMLLLVFFRSTDRQLLDRIDPLLLHILRY